MVYVHLAYGFEEIEALTVVDVLRRGGVEVETVSITDELNVVGAHGIQVNADITFANANYDDCEMIVLPGGLPGATNLRDHEGLKAKICQFAETNKWIAAICASPSVILGAYGLLENHKATCYPGMEEGMVGAKAENVGAICDDNIITGKGPAYATEFALLILEKLTNESNANSVASGFLYER